MAEDLATLLTPVLSAVTGLAALLGEDDSPGPTSLLTGLDEDEAPAEVGMFDFLFDEDDGAVEQVTPRIGPEGIERGPDGRPLDNSWMRVFGSGGFLETKIAANRPTVGLNSLNAGKNREKARTINLRRNKADPKRNTRTR